LTAPLRVIATNIIDLLDGAKVATADFSSLVGDFSNSKVGFIQVIYSNLSTFTGTFTLHVSGICDPATLCLLPNSEIKVDATCACVGWNLTHIGFVFW